MSEEHGQTLPELFGSESFIVPQKLGLHRIGDVEERLKTYVLEIRGIAPHGSAIKDVFLMFEDMPAVLNFASKVIEQSIQMDKSRDTTSQPTSDSDTDGQSGTTKANEP